MSKKKKDAPVVHLPTKRQLTRWQKQKLRQRIIFGIGAAVIALVVILVGTGVYIKWSKVGRPMREVVVEVGSAGFTMGYLVDAVEYWMEYYYGASWVGQAAYASSFIDMALDGITSSEVMRQEAEKVGITASEAEIDEKLQDNPDRKNRFLRDIARSTVIYEKLSKEYFSPQLPAEPEQRQILAMFLESQTQLNAVKAELEAGADFGELAAQYSLDATTKEKKGDLGFRPRGIISSLLGSDVVEDAIFSQEIGALGELLDINKIKQLGYLLVKVTEISEDGSQARVSGILLGSAEEAEAVQARLEKGEDFTALAEEASQVWTEDKKDDLGWFTKDADDVLTDYIFGEDTVINAVSPVIKYDEANTTGGYWLVKIIGVENRAISEDDRTVIIGDLYDDWLTEAKEAAGDSIEDNLDDKHRAWVVSYLTGALS